ncbi:MAG: hypothetical protein U5K71_09400 [Gracilimonas sp.]|nr:hypothetical protein [Gracilimonas sp.]
MMNLWKSWKKVSVFWNRPEIFQGTDQGSPEIHALNGDKEQAQESLDNADTDELNVQDKFLLAEVYGLLSETDRGMDLLNEMENDLKLPVYVAEVAALKGKLAD